MVLLHKKIAAKKLVGNSILWCNNTEFLEYK